MKKNKFLVVIAGPTAVGKTNLCLNLAKIFNSEIISADSRQFYKELELGTAKPTLEEMAIVTHHFINIHSIHDPYDVKQYEQDALLLLEKLFINHDILFLTGGSGLYIEAVCEGFDEIPEVDPTIRKKLIQHFEQEGIEFLQTELSQVDPDFFKVVDQQNPQRLMRALEVYRGSGMPFSHYRKRDRKERPFHILKVGLERDRPDLYQRIDNRMDDMIKNGLFEEAKSLFPFRHLNALQTVGYSEIFGYLEGKYDEKEAIRLLKRNSRRYAKRQLTWFKKDRDMSWYHPDQSAEVLEFINSHTSL